MGHYALSINPGNDLFLLETPNEGKKGSINVYAGIIIGFSIYDVTETTARMLE